MTPAIKSAKKANINFKIHEYEHQPSDDGYGLEAARKLRIAPERIFKTLVLELDAGELCVCVVPVDQKLNLKAAAKACGAKKAQMANPTDVQRTTGYVLGGVSPLGQKKRLKTVVDKTAKCFTSICVSAGKRGLEIELNYSDLLKLTKAELAPLCKTEKIENLDH